MSKYSQLPRDTLTLLEHRAQRLLQVHDYVKWAGNALIDGFDSRSLAILASLDYREISQIEAPEYFLRAVKELNLPIPDCELACGNWYWTNVLYRQLGLSLPDEEYLLGQHLIELAEQIKEGVIDPIIGSERIYREVIFEYKYPNKKYGLGRDVRDEATYIGWDGEGVWEWDEFIDYIKFVNDERPNKSYDKNSEIIAFAIKWLKNQKSKQISSAPIHNEQAKKVRRKSNTVAEVIQKHITEERQNSFQINLQDKNLGVTRREPNITTGDEYLSKKKLILIEVILVIFTTTLTFLLLYSIFFFALNFFARGEKVSVWTVLGSLFSIFVFGAVSVGYSTELWFDILRLRKRREWIKNAIQVIATIIDRKAEYNDYAESKEQLWSCEFTVKYPVNRNSYLVEMAVKTKVSDSIYFRYKNQSTILIYVARSDPRCFLIEGE